MSLPMDQRARTWIANMETGEMKQFLTCPYGFRATHESWSPNGERFFFFKKSVPGWMPVSIASISKEGDDWQEYYTNDTIRLGHGRASDDGKWFISDGQDPGYNPLVLLNLETGDTEFLCWADASIKEGHGAHAHVHPSFSSSGRFVTYTSDKTGTPQVYVVPL
jgi:Tol biopolymer transport system component